MINGGLILIFILGFLAILQNVVKIIRQQKHVDDYKLRKIIDTTIKYDKDYDAVIGHLGLCEKCQKRLDEISRE